MKFSNPIKYLLKVLFSTLTISPIVVVLTDYLYNNFKYDNFILKGSESLLLFGYLFFLGILATIPIFFIMLILISQINTINNNLIKKGIISFVTVFIFAIIFWFEFKDDIFNNLGDNSKLIFIFLSYLIITIGSIFFYKLKPNSLLENF